MKLPHPTSRFVQLFVTAGLAIMCSIASAAPLTNSPTRYQVIQYMEPELKTFGCYCDFNRTTGRVDASGCEAPGDRAVIGNIVPASVIKSWVAETPDKTIDVELLLKGALRDPLNLTLLTDEIAKTYHSATQVLASDQLRGEFGACILHHDRTTGAISIPTARMTEFARTALYLADEYGLPLPEHLRQHYNDVAAAYPPTKREYNRNNGAYEWNGSWNDYIADDRPVPPRSNAIRRGIIEGIHRRYVEGK